MVAYSVINLKSNPVSLFKADIKSVTDIYQRLDQNVIKINGYGITRIFHQNIPNFFLYIRILLRTGERNFVKQRENTVIHYRVWARHWTETTVFAKRSDGDDSASFSGATHPSLAIPLPSSPSTSALFRKTLLTGNVSIMKLKLCRFSLQTLTSSRFLMFTRTKRTSTSSSSFVTRPIFSAESPSESSPSQKLSPSWYFSVSVSSKVLKLKMNVFVFSAIGVENQYIHL